MSKLSPHEKKIWQQGFFCGLRTYKQKHNSDELEPELIEVRNIVLSHIDGKYCQVVAGFKKAYRKETDFKRGSLKRFSKIQKDVQYYRAVLAFYAFCQSVGIDAFLDYLKDSAYFEEVLYSKGAENE